MKVPQINTTEAFKNFETRVTTSVKRGKPISPKSFYQELTEIGGSFERKNNKETMNRNSKRLAETLVSLDENNLAGIIYSFLIKFNPNNPKLREQLITNALALAKKLQDPVHIAARASNLYHLYKETGRNNENYLKFLYESKRALAKVVNNYENARKKYSTVKRKIKPLEVYEAALYNLKIVIAECIKDKHPKQALEELKSAEAILIKNNENKKLEHVRKLISTLESKLLKQNISKHRSN